MLIETAPWIHPLYRGCLTLEIANVSNTPILLYPGFPIGQLILMELKDPVDAAQALIGTYVGPIEPEAPELKAPIKRGDSLPPKSLVNEVNRLVLQNLPH